MAEEKKEAAAEAPAEAAADDAVQKKGEKGEGGGPAFNPKLVFIFLGLNSLILVIIAVLFVMQYSKRSQEVSLADVAASSEGEHGGEHGGGHGEAKEGGGEHGGGEKKEGAEGADNFIKETFTVNLKDSKGAHYAKLNVEIEVDDDFVKEEVKKQIPRIRDFIVVTLSSKTYEQIESVDGREFLREDIRNKINGYLTRGQIKNVYFTEFIIQ